MQSMKIEYRTQIRTILSVLVLSVLCVTTYAQTGKIQGVVTDPNGAAITGARVEAIDESKGSVIRETITDSNGSFQLLPLNRGTWTIKVTSTGFRAVERKGLVLDAYQIVDLKSISMELGELTNSVIVTSDTPIVETATANKSFVITGQQVTGISTNGRDFRSLFRTLPGVSSGMGTASDFNLGFNSTQGFNVNGLRDTMNNVYLDGTINTDVGANDGQFTQVSLDAIGEFKVQNSNFNAEHGRNPGILISATTKSGGKQFHGTAYEFLRNDALDARNAFTDSKQKLRFNQFGGNFSGPIPLGRLSPLSDPKMFFFFNMEFTKGTRPNGGTFVDVVHPDILNGDFRKLLRTETLTGSSCLYPGESSVRSCQVGTIFKPGTVLRDSKGNVIGGTPYANNIVPKSEWSANAPAFVKLVGSLNRAGAQSVAGSPELVRVFNQDAYNLDKRQQILRFDYNINQNNNFFFRWVDDSQSENQGLGMFSGNSFPNLPQYRSKPGSSWSWNLSTVVSPNVTNEFIFGYNHLTQIVDIREGTDPATYDRKQLGFTFQDLFPAANTQQKFPRFNCGIGGCNFFSFPNQWESEGRQFAFTDNVTVIRGSHTFKTGGLFNMNKNGQQPFWIDATEFNFGGGPKDTNNPFANMLLGNYSSAFQGSGKFFGDFKFYGLEVYGQDSWKVSSKFNLEYGVRWSYLGPTFTHGQYLMNYFLADRYNPSKAVKLNPDGSIIPGSGDPLNGIVQEGNGIPNGGVKHRYNNISPRLGVAYDLFGDGKTAIRGGFGIFFERVRQNNNYFDGLGNPPVLDTPNVFSGNVDAFGPQLVAGGARFPQNLIAIDPDGKIPAIYSWSLGIQHQLPGQLGLDVSYVGNASRNLMYQRNINQVPLGSYVGFTGNANTLRPYKGYQNITYVEYGASGNYHGLQARLGRRFGNNFTFNANYTWSKAIADVDDDTTTIGYFLDRKRERGVTGFDRTHIFTFDYIYNLPTFRASNPLVRGILGGWTVSGVTRLWSGLPFTITADGDPGTFGGGVRADYIGGPIYVKDKDSREWFNAKAFGVPLGGSLGNTGRNAFRGPGIISFDASLFKNFKFSERVNLQYRAEFFNIFNHLNPFAINTNISGPLGTQINNSTRGQSGFLGNTVRDPRNIQMALKLTF